MNYSQHGGGGMGGAVSHESPPGGGGIADMISHSGVGQRRQNRADRIITTTGMGLLIL